MPLRGNRRASVESLAAFVRESAPAELRTGESVWVACASGYRASIAAGLLERGGYRPVVLVNGGVTDVLDRL